MKKIILSAVVLLGSFVLAAQPDVSNMTFDRMPTDAEIRAVINKYDFDEAQKEFLFRDTKRKIQMMYNQKTTMGEALGTTPQGAEFLQSANGALEQQSQGNGKKYANHAPLTRRSSRD